MTCSVILFNFSTRSSNSSWSLWVKDNFKKDHTEILAGKILHFDQITTPEFRCRRTILKLFDDLKLFSNT